ncbi:MAG: hypothetical protein LC780_13890 [Acidobacteria bacterium]|nr:hypothetical protein [Acidobacteriota bacterium]
MPAGGFEEGAPVAPAGDFGAAAPVAPAGFGSATVVLMRFNTSSVTSVASSA